MAGIEIGYEVGDQSYAQRCWPTNFWADNSNELIFSSVDFIVWGDVDTGSYGAHVTCVQVAGGNT